LVASGVQQVRNAVKSRRISSGLERSDKKKGKAAIHSRPFPFH
jgi:hypothetical protein